jgi:hypothetical protein
MPTLIKTVIRLALTLRRRRYPSSLVHLRAILKDQLIEIRLLNMLEGIWIRPSALRPAPSPWRTARGMPADTTS